MPSVGRGVRELRIHEAGEHRVLYLASLPEAVYVLHAFQKQTGRTRWADLELARRRFRDLEHEAGGAP
jgi:phage-related protein